MFAVVTFRVAAFDVVAKNDVALRVVMFVVERLEVPVTFRVVVIRAVAALRLVRLEVPVTFKFVPKIEAAFRVVTLVVERLEVPVTLREVPKTDDAFRETTFTVEDCKLRRLEVPVTFKFVPKIEVAFRVVTLVVERLEVPVTLRVARLEVPVTLREVATFTAEDCKLTRFETPGATFREFRIPKLVTLGWEA
jgi:hypothetical protein